MDFLATLVIFGAILGLYTTWIAIVVLFIDASRRKAVLGVSAILFVLTLIAAYLLSSSSLFKPHAQTGGTTGQGQQPYTQPGGSPPPAGPRVPTDDASFTINWSANAPYVEEAIYVNEGGVPVCGTLDDGSQHSIRSTTTSGIPLTATFTTACSGSYQHGHLLYTETATNLEVDLANGDVCTATGPFVFQQLVGDFSSATDISGDYSAPGADLPCYSGQTFPLYPVSGSWSGSTSEHKLLISA